MSRRIESGTEKDIKGISGKLEVIPDRLTDEVLKATEWRPDSVRVVFKVKNDPNDKEVSWAIPIESPDLRPFTRKVPKGEKALRKEIEGMLTTEPTWANVYNNFIQRWLCPPGKHLGRLNDIRQTVSREGVTRWFIQLVTEDNQTTEFPAKWHGVEMEVGEMPDQDWAGPKELLNSGKSPFYYLCQLGLEWDRWIQELENAEALFPGHYDSDGRQIAPYFEDMDDWTLTMLKAVQRHGLAQVKWETERHPQYVLSMVKGNIWFELEPLLAKGTPEEQAFRDEKEVFLELWENLSRVILEKDDVRFVAGVGIITEDAKPIVKGILVPIVRAYPGLVKQHREDGIPMVTFPIERDNWFTNSLAVLGFLAERLMKVDDVFEVVNLTDPKTLLAWAEENVSELKDDMSVDEQEF
jgi:hypothetical protein